MEYKERTPQSILAVCYVRMRTYTTLASTFKKHYQKVEKCALKVLIWNNKYSVMGVLCWIECQIFARRMCAHNTPQ